MLKIKLILMVIMLAGAGGGYLYVKKLQKDNAILKVNQIKLETAVEDNNQVIEQQTADLKKIRSTLEVIDEKNRKLQEDKDKLSLSACNFLFDSSMTSNVTLIALKSAVCCSMTALLSSTAVSNLI